MTHNGNETRQAENAAARIFFAQTVESQEQAMGVIALATRAADAGAVFGVPLEQSGYTIITASELAVGVGLGFGAGGSFGEREPGETAGPQGESGSGGNGGGGGWSLGRPVAAIIIGPDGVRVEPIFDMTKVGIAAITAAGALLLSWRAMVRGR